MPRHVCAVVAVRSLHGPDPHLYMRGMPGIVSCGCCTQVVVLDKMDYCASRSNLASIDGLPNFKFVAGDILSMVRAGWP